MSNLYQFRYLIAKGIRRGYIRISILGFVIGSCLFVGCGANEKIAMNNVDMLDYSCLDSESAEPHIVRSAIDLVEWGDDFLWVGIFPLRGVKGSGIKWTNAPVQELKDMILHARKNGQSVVVTVRCRITKNTEFSNSWYMVDPRIKQLGEMQSLEIINYELVDEISYQQLDGQWDYLGPIPGKSEGK